MRSTKQNPLVGATRIKIFESLDQLKINAELGGVVFMSRFVKWFPIGLCLFLGVVLSSVLAAVVGPGPWGLVAGVFAGCIFLYALFVGPKLAKWIESRTAFALDNLLRNMTAVAGESGKR